MNRLELKRMNCLSGKDSIPFDVILWGILELEGLEEDELSADSASSFSIEVRETWTPVFKDGENHRQVSLIEVGSLGVAEQIYDYTAETLLNL